MKIEKSPWKVGKYKNCNNYGEASVDVDQDADVTLHFLHVASIHALDDSAQKERDANLRVLAPHNIFSMSGSPIDFHKIVLGNQTTHLSSPQVH